VKSAISGIDNAHERLMKTARLAFEAQNFTLRPPEAPVIAATETEDSAANAADAGAPAAPAMAITAAHESSPAEAVTAPSTPDSAPAAGGSAPQGS